jgi:hypothetical protein
MVLFSRGMNQILTKHMAGNKSGALLLTIFALTAGAAMTDSPTFGKNHKNHDKVT